MKRNTILAVLVICIASALLIQGCEKMEQPTYSQTFFRIATVKIKNDQAYLYTDKLHESFYPKNLQTPEDASRIGLVNNQHIIAVLTVDAVGTMSNNSITFNAFARLDTTKCVGQKPADTLNYYYYFTPYDFDRMVTDSVYPSYIYPRVWAEGHVMHITPTYFTPTGTDKAEFHLYPFDVQGDTLMMRLYSDIPECDASLYPSTYFQTLLSIDVSSVRDSADNPTEQILRDTIWHRLDRLKDSNKQKITVTVVTPDSLRAKNSKNPNGSYNQRISGLPVSIKVPLDF